MKRRGWGRIVNMASSTFGTVALGYVHYIASKGGMIGLTRALASELGPARRHRQRHRADADAHARRDEARPAPGRRDMEQAFVDSAARQAIPRPKAPADLVGTLSFLTSDDAAFVTGQTLYVNGGLVRSVM